MPAPRASLNTLTAEQVRVPEWRTPATQIAAEADREEKGHQTLPPGAGAMLSISILFDNCQAAEKAVR